jgi:serine/threonine-protein kinase HipA
MKTAKIFFNKTLAGFLTSTDEGYEFAYEQSYLEDSSLEGVSLTLPKEKKIFKSKTMFPFFDGLIPEGFLLKIALKTWKVKENDRMELLLKCCRDCIGAVSVEEIK